MLYFKCFIHLKAEMELDISLTLTVKGSGHFVFMALTGKLVPIQGQHLMLFHSFSGRQEKTDFNFL